MKRTGLDSLCLFHLRCAEQAPSICSKVGPGIMNVTNQRFITGLLLATRQTHKLTLSFILKLSLEWCPASSRGKGCLMFMPLIFSNLLSSNSNFPRWLSLFDEFSSCDNSTYLRYPKTAEKVLWKANKQFSASTPLTKRESEKIKIIVVILALVRTWGWFQNHISCSKILRNSVWRNAVCDVLVITNRVGEPEKNFCFPKKRTSSNEDHPLQ